MILAGAMPSLGARYLDRFSQYRWKRIYNKQSIAGTRCRFPGVASRQRSPADPTVKLRAYPLLDRTHTRRSHYATRVVDGQAILTVSFDCLTPLAFFNKKEYLLKVPLLPPVAFVPLRAFFCPANKKGDAKSPRSILQGFSAPPFVYGRLCFCIILRKRNRFNCLRVARYDHCRFLSSPLVGWFYLPACKDVPTTVRRVWHTPRTAGHPCP